VIELAEYTDRRLETEIDNITLHRQALTDSCMVLVWAVNRDGRRETEFDKITVY